jgi:lipoate-protein ligase A
VTTIWRLLQTPAARGSWNMAVDEAMLEHIGRGEARPTLRLYGWAPPCLSLGHAQPYGDVDVERLRARGWELVRRPTGGRAILHADELTYSVTAPLEEPVVAGSVLESYNRLAAALLSAVRTLGVAAEIERTASGADDPSNPVCFEVPSSNEITANGKKLIGSAQARRKEGVLQHGSLPLIGDLSRITEVLAFESDAGRSAAARRLRARATTAESVLGHAISWEAAAAAVSEAFRTVLKLQLEPGPLSPNELSRTRELIRDKYDHPRWTQRV